MQSSRYEKIEQQLGAGRSVLALVAPFFRRYALRLAMGFFALLSVDFLQLAIPRFIKAAVDHLEKGSASEALLAQSAGAIFLVAVAIALCRFLWRWLILGFSRLLERDLRDWLLHHLLTLDRPFFQKKPPGEIMALATNDLAAVQLAGGMGLVAAADALVMSVAAMAAMAYISPSLTLIGVLPMPLLALLTRILSGRLHHRFLAVQQQFSRLTEFARSTIANIRLLKAYTQSRSQTARFERLGRDYVRDNIRLAMVQGTLFPVSGLVGNLSLLLVLFFGGRQAIAGTITLGDFVAFIAYLAMLTWPMMAIGWVTNLFQRGMTSLGRIREVMAARAMLRDPEKPIAAPQAAGEIRVNHLDFSYGAGGEPALADLDFTVRPGEFIGIVGKSGSGKSTLCHILARLLPVADGRLFWAGLDVNRLALAAVRHRIAYVPQDVVLFADTIAANIGLGDPDAGQDEIEAAARACMIHEEIVSFGDGYQTRVGERGVRLSGGQRQRIALARAILLKRPVVIIDDSLSAVDMETEQAIIRGLAPYLAGRTCITVSHRIAPLAEAHRILVLDGGRLVAQGTHAELIVKSPFYATMYERQLVASSRETGGGHAL